MQIKSYIVNPGDNLSKIAAANGTTVEAILSANSGITNPNLIMVGQQIIIPETVDVSSVSAETLQAQALAEQQAAAAQAALAAQQEAAAQAAAVQAAQAAAMQLQNEQAEQQAAVQAAQAAAQAAAAQAAATQAAQLQAAQAAQAAAMATNQPPHTGPLNSHDGWTNGPSGKETYYDLNMKGCFGAVAQADLLKASMNQLGLEYPRDFHIRADGVKCLGDYVMVAADINLRPKGTIVDTSLGKGIVVDTGGFAAANPTQLDIATNWTHHRNI